MQIALEGVEANELTPEKSIEDEPASAPAPAPKPAPKPEDGAEDDAANAVLRGEITSGRPVRVVGQWGFGRASARAPFCARARARGQMVRVA